MCCLVDRINNKIRSNLLDNKEECTYLMSTPVHASFVPKVSYFKYAVLVCASGAFCWCPHDPVSLLVHMLINNRCLINVTSH